MQYKKSNNGCKTNKDFSIALHPKSGDAAVKKQSGFTLIELMITIVISAILIGVALPNLSGFLAQMRANSEVREIQRLLLTARNTAINSDQNVEFCPLTDDNACTNGTDWSGRIGIVTESDEFILEREGVTGSDQLVFSGTTVIYGPTGKLVNAADSFLLFRFCPKNYEDYSRGVEVSVTGRTYASVDINGDGKDQDRDGSNITCD